MVGTSGQKGTGTRGNMAGSGNWDGRKCNMGTKWWELVMKKGI